MTFHERHGDDADAMAIGSLLRNESEQSAAPNWQAAGLERLVRAASVVQQVSAPKHPLRALGLVAATLALAVGGAWLTLDRAAGNKVSFEVQGAELSKSNYVVAPLDTTAHMTFSDGSTVDLTRSAQLRVQQLTPQGAILALERGAAMTHVVHRAKSNWKLLAGPFEISVIGTRFRTEWDPTSETLQVDLYEGTLQIGGQRAGESAVLKNGQRFHAVGRTSNWSISPIEGPKDVTAAATPTQPPPALASADSSESGKQFGASSSTAHPASNPTARTLAHDWASAVARGEFSRVVDEAESRGVATCLDQCSTADLRHLADAARYTRHFELSEQALMALRRRAPGEAPGAAYLLGALNESQGRSMAALRWYFQSVTEAPQGRYVSEAQAGRMRMLLATQQSQAAREVAEQYLQDYPRGVGVATARKILSAP